MPVYFPSKLDYQDGNLSFTNLTLKVMMMSPLLGHAAKTNGKILILFFFFFFFFVATKLELFLASMYLYYLAGDDKFTTMGSCKVNRITAH